MQMMSAANVALDIGVHLELEIPKAPAGGEGERCNAGIAWEFLRAHSSWCPEHPVTHRILLLPSHGRTGAYRGYRLEDGSRQRVAERHNRMGVQAILPASYGAPV